MVFTVIRVVGVIGVFRGIRVVGRIVIVESLDFSWREGLLGLIVFLAL